MLRSRTTPQVDLHGINITYYLCFLLIYNVYYPFQAHFNHGWRSSVVQGFSGTVAPAQYFRQFTGGASPRHSVPRFAPIAWFSAKPSWAARAGLSSRGAKMRRQRTSGTKDCDLNVFRTPRSVRKCDVNVQWTPQDATSTHFRHASGPCGEENWCSGRSGPSFGHFLINSSLRKDENWCSGRPGAVIWSFPY